MSISMIVRDKKFWPLFWTQFLGALNDNFLKNALVVLITFKGVQLFGMGSSSIVALASAIFILPFVVLSPLAGQLSDKFEKSMLVRYTKIMELVIMVIACLGFYLELYPLLLVVLFLMGTQSTLFGPVKYSIIPELVEEEKLIQGNAYVELGTFLAILIGTIAGGLVVSSSSMLLYLCVGLLGFAGFGWLTSTRLPTVPVANPDLKIEYNPLPTIKNMWTLLKENVAVFNSVFAISWFWFVGAGILSLLPVYCKDYLHVNEEVVTAFLAMFTIGIAVGSIICEKLCFSRVEIGLVPIGSLGLSIFLFDISIVTPQGIEGATNIDLMSFIALPGAKRLLIDFFLMSVFGGIFIVPLYTLLQERSRPEVRSQIIAGNNIINSFFMIAASVALMGFYASELSLPHIFLLFGLMNIIVAIYIYTVVPEFVLRFISWVLVHMMYRVKTEGLEHIPKEGPVVLTCNHVTFVDWLVIAGSCPRPTVFIMYYKFFHIPVIQTLMKQAKVIPICSAKEDPEVLKQAFASIQKALEDGEVVCIFPEGQLTPDGNRTPFREGVCRIIEKTPVPVIPMSLSGMWGSIFSKQKGSKWIRPIHQFWRKVHLHVHPPIPPQDLELDKLKEIIESSITKP